MKTSHTLLLIVALLLFIWIFMALYNKDTDKDYVELETTSTESSAPNPVEVSESVTTDAEAPLPSAPATIVSETVNARPGSYETFTPGKLAYADNGDVVLFFKASWCPSCRVLDTSIKENISSIPEGLTILEVDYDSNTELRKQYGVTTQHTLVQVDSSGTLIQKWSGGSTLSTIVERI